MEFGTYESIEFLFGKPEIESQVSRVVYLYYVDGLLIDMGPQSMKDPISRQLSDWDVEQVILTHYHEDHSGMGEWVESHLGVPIYTDAKDIPLLQKPAHLSPMRRQIWGERPPFFAQAIGSTLHTPHFTFQVLETPGHCPYHISLYEPERKWLFGGDLYLTSHQRTAMPDESNLSLIRSLKKVLQLKVETYFCAHRGLLPDATASLQRKLDYLERCHEEMMGLREKGYAVEEIAEILFPEEEPIVALSKGEFSHVQFVRSFFPETPFEPI